MPFVEIENRRIRCLDDLPVIADLVTVRVVGPEGGKPCGFTRDDTVTMPFTVNVKNAYYGYWRPIRTAVVASTGSEQDASQGNG